MADGRQKVSLNTEPEPPDVDSPFTGHYDQICAISQGAINRAFQKAFTSAPEPSDLVWYENDAKSGMIQAKMDCPMIAIGADDGPSPSILYKLRFKSGSLKTVLTDDLAIDLAGWEIAVPVNLNNILPTTTTPAQPTGNAPALQQLDAESLKVKLKPGEYSVHRLFVALHAAEWGAPIITQSAYPGPDGIKLPLEKLVASGGLSKTARDRLLELVTNWVTAHRQSAFLTLGYRVNLNVSDSDPKPPKYEPKQLYLQTYPYLDRAEQDIFQDFNSLPRTDTLGRDNNCLVFCETTGDNNPPGTKRLPFSANLSSAPVAHDNGGFDGSFVVDRRIFMQKYLLPMLQGFCRSSQLIPLRPDSAAPWFGAYESEPWEFFGSLKPRFAFGTSPERPEDKASLPNPPNTDRSRWQDPFFAFQSVGPFKYAWHDRVVAPDKPHLAEVPGGGSTFLPRPPDYAQVWTGNKPGGEEAKKTLRYEFISNIDVSVGWKPLDRKVTVSAKLRYDHNIYAWSKVEAAQREHFQYTVTGSWSLRIGLDRLQKTQDGTFVRRGIFPSITGIKGGLPQDFELSGRGNDADHTGIRARELVEMVRPGIQDALKFIITEYVGRFSEGKEGFIFSGYTELDFGVPKLSELGDLIVNIRYKEPSGTRLSGRPLGIMPSEARPPDVISNSSNKKQPVPDQKKPRLVWSVAMTRTAGESGSSTAHLTIKGQRDPTDTEPAGFRSIAIGFEALAETQFRPFFKETMSKKWRAKDAAAADPNAKSAPGWPDNTWQLQPKGLGNQKLKVWADDVTGLPRLVIDPDGTAEEGASIKKFKVDGQSSAIVLELEGQANPAGNYNLLIKESWTDPNLSLEPGDSRFDGHAEAVFPIPQ